MHARSLRGLTAALTTATASLALSSPALAASPLTVFPTTPNPITCQTQADGVRYCQGDASHLIPSFDGAPIDVNVVLPPKPAAGADGNYPLIGFYHGWGGSKYDINTGGAGLSQDGWAKQGVATFSMSDRGWGASCGGGADYTGTLAQSACVTKGYNHLLDTRYEVHDAQYLISLLADQQLTPGVDLVDPQRIGAQGGSYGGGMAMALAALKDRVMTPSGALVPWVSPNGQRMRIAAAAPEIPWTDLSNSLLPNGHTLDYAIAKDNYGPNPGVMKATFVSGLFAAGLAGSYYAPPQYDADSDLYTWYAGTVAGEPYEFNPLTASVLGELQQHHSSYYIDHSEAPAPLLISNGFTDDLFPVDEALRFYNRTMAQYPHAFLGMTFLDYGHQRGQNKDADTSRLSARQQAFLTHFLLHRGEMPTRGVEAMTQACGSNSASPLYSAPTWAGLQQGEVRLDSDATSVISGGGDPREGAAFDPIAGPGACATATDQGDLPGEGSYRIPVTGKGFTLLGAATVIAELRSPSPTDQIAVRLLDVDGAGNETLVARGLYRPSVSVNPATQVFQTHPGAYFFAPGHTVRLELLAFDAPYSRPSNGHAAVVISHLQLRLPTHDAPGGQVTAMAPKFLPPGYTLAPDYRAARHHHRTR